MSQEFTTTTQCCPPPPPPQMTSLPAAAPPALRPIPRPALKRTVGVPRGMVPARSARRWLSAARAAAGLGIAAAACGAGWVLASTFAVLVRHGRSAEAGGCARGPAWDALAVLLGSFVVLAGPAAYLAAAPGDDKARWWLVIALLALPGPALGVRALSRGCTLPASDGLHRLTLAWTLVLGTLAVCRAAFSSRTMWSRRRRRLGSVDPALPGE